MPAIGSNRIIALRKGDYDFHFMVFNPSADVANGVGWYHKPEIPSAILKFTNMNKLNEDYSFKSNETWLLEGYSNIPYRAVYYENGEIITNIQYDSNIM